MEGEDNSYGPRMETDNRSADGIAVAAELSSVVECPPTAELDDSQVVGVSTMVSAAGGGEAAPAAADAEVKADEGDCGKRKRGRPPRGQVKSPPMKKMKDEEEEDVCFICFDGGSLVLCDRRGCPKAYHAACIKRDEAFFRSRAKWNCGWHICSICQKAAHYMCYTCTFSLCKACTKKADYVCVRENKGFCTTCMKTIMMIENNDQGNKDMPQVDFDDKSSWEYLFKVYWIYLKGKLSLTLDELTQAKSPWKAAGTVAGKGQSLNTHYFGSYGKGTIFNSPFGHLEANNSKRRTKEQAKLPNNEDSPSTGKSSCDEGTTSNGSAEWASKELLEFVAHMKNGDTLVLSQFDVQCLLLDYIKRNSLRDPRRKSQIICDLRLKNLFGKPRVGHFEMLKLLEFHFVMKEDVRKDVIGGNIVDAALSLVEVGGNNENPLMMSKDKKRKTRSKGEDRGPQINLAEYAAIDVHNINLIYLRRNLMESLVADSGKFHEKVVGSIVRIRISISDQKQDMYRLVQVVGTSKVAEPYKIGDKTADIMLEILNLDKKETISIDVISNQAFSEDECRRLRQSIKCGLVKRLTIGQVQEKAVALQEVRLNDRMETEVLRLNHLRDRASEKGHKKGLRECVEKLELLKSPEERQRRLHEIPEVHADPNMDPNCDSDEDAGEVDNKKLGEPVKPRYSGLGRNRREPISRRNGGSENNSSSRAWKKLTTCEQNRSMSTKSYLDKGAPGRLVQRVYESSLYEGKDSCGSNGSEKPGNQADSSGLMAGGLKNQAVLRSESCSVGAPDTSISSLSAGGALAANASETDKLWHYRDPNGKIQGPFCVVQLRKWSTTGYFPPEMRIWRINNEEVDSLLLTDVLNGKFHKVFPLRYNISLPSQGITASDSRLNHRDDSNGSMNTTGTDGKRSDRGWNSSNAISHSSFNEEFMKGDGWGSQSSNWTAPVVNNKEVRIGSSSQCSDSLKVNNSYSDHPQVNCPLPSSKFTERQNETSHEGKGHEGIRWNSGSKHENQSDSQGYSGQLSGESRRPLPISLSSNDGDSNSGFASVVRSTDSSEPKSEINIPDLPSPTPKTSNGDLEDQTIKAQPSVPFSLPFQDSGIQKLPSPTAKPTSGDEKSDSNIRNLPSSPLKPRDGDEKVHAAENRQQVSSKFVVQDSGPSWSSASSIVVGGETQCPEIVDEWGRYSPIPAKPSVEEWDSGLGSVTSLKLPEGASDHAATPTSKCDQLSPSPSHPGFNESRWQVIVTEPIEFSTLDEESVSDLLAEVDAMESRCGLGSPTSVMYSADELFQDSGNDCFTSIGGFSSALDSGKSDALSSTGDMVLPHKSTMTGEPLGVSQADVHDHVKRSSVQSSICIEVEVETRPTDISVNQSESGSNSQVPASSALSRGMIETDDAQRAGLKPMNAGWGTMQGNMNLGLGGLTYLGYGTGLGTAQGNASTNRSTSAGYMGWENQPIYGGERFIGIDWESSHGDGGGAGGSYSRAPP